LPIPDRIWINYEIRSVLALIETARLVGADLALEAMFGQFLLEQFLQYRLAGGIAASPRTSRRAPVAADENVFFEPGHEDVSVSQRLIDKFFDGRVAWVPLSSLPCPEVFSPRAHADCTGHQLCVAIRRVGALRCFVHIFSAFHPSKL